MSIIENNWMYEPSTTGTNKDVETIITGDTDSDYVKVVRCENCEYGIENGELCGRKVYLCSCMTNPNEFYGDFYCAFGERKDEK